MAMQRTLPFSKLPVRAAACALRVSVFGRGEPWSLWREQ
jgi:hypothetical protein